MTTDGNATLRVGEDDEELTDRLDRELTAFNSAATGAYDEKELSVRATDAAGELVGGLTGYTWGGLTGYTWGGLGAIHMLWVREDARHEGWGSRLMRAAEAEVLRRGGDRMTVSSYTFQAPDFYRGLGYEEVGRQPGVPGGHEDVYFFRKLDGAQRQ